MEGTTDSRQQPTGVQLTPLLTETRAPSGTKPPSPIETRTMLGPYTNPHRLSCPRTLQSIMQASAAPVIKCCHCPVEPRLSERGFEAPGDMLLRALLEGSNVVQGSHLAALMSFLGRDIHAALESGLAICSRPEAVYAQQPQSTLQQQLPVCDGLGPRYGGKPSSAAGALPGALPAVELRDRAWAEHVPNKGLIGV